MGKCMSKTPSTVAIHCDPINIKCEADAEFYKHKSTMKSCTYERFAKHLQKKIYFSLTLPWPFITHFVRRDYSAKIFLASGIRCIMYGLSTIR